MLWLELPHTYRISPQNKQVFSTDDTEYKGLGNVFGLFITVFGCHGLQDQIPLLNQRYLAGYYHTI